MSDEIQMIADVSVAQFTFDEPLYKPFKVNNKSEIKFLREDTEFHGYNPIDNMETTFEYSQKNPASFGLSSEQQIEQFLIYCVRSKNRFYITVLWNPNDMTITKIGQYPSVADFHIAKIKTFKNVFTPDQSREFVKAVGLAAHGVGIGSFVYLRRIFEQLVQEAFDFAKDKDKIDPVVFGKARMDEKIEILKNHLPPVLIETKYLYGILSSGIHELDEATCLAHFENVRLAIQIILEEKQVEYDRKKRNDDARARLAQSHAEIKTKKLI